MGGLECQADGRKERRASERERKRAPLRQLQHSPSVSLSFSHSAFPFQHTLHPRTLLQLYSLPHSHSPTTSQPAHPAMTMAHHGTPQWEADILGLFVQRDRHEKAFTNMVESCTSKTLIILVCISPSFLSNTIYETTGTLILPCVNRQWTRSKADLLCRPEQTPRVERTEQQGTARQNGPSGQRSP
jgi:hypothetical protein